MSDVFALATSAPVKPPPGPVQYNSLRPMVEHREEHGRLQLAVNVATDEPFVLQIKVRPDGTYPVTGDPLDVLNARNLAIHALRAESHALSIERDALGAEDKRTAEQDRRVSAIVNRVAEIDAEIKAQPKVSALICAPVARALMLYSAQENK